jgi:hypothetical protein
MEQSGENMEQVGEGEPKGRVELMSQYVQRQLFDALTHLYMEDTMPPQNIRNFINKLIFVPNKDANTSNTIQILDFIGQLVYVKNDESLKQKTDNFFSIKGKNTKNAYDTYYDITRSMAGKNFGGGTEKDVYGNTKKDIYDKIMNLTKTLKYETQYVLLSMIVGVEGGDSENSMLMLFKLESIFQIIFTPDKKQILDYFLDINDKEKAADVGGGGGPVGATGDGGGSGGATGAATDSSPASSSSDEAKVEDPVPVPASTTTNVIPPPPPPGNPPNTPLLEYIKDIPSILDIVQSTITTKLIHTNTTDWKESVELVLQYLDTLNTLLTKDDSPLSDIRENIEKYTLYTNTLDEIKTLINKNDLDVSTKEKEDRKEIIQKLKTALELLSSLSYTNEDMKTKINNVFEQINIDILVGSRSTFRLKKRSSKKSQKQSHQSSSSSKSAKHSS